MTKKTKTKNLTGTDAPRQLVDVPRKAGLIFGIENNVISLNSDLTKQAFGAEDDGFKEGILDQVVQLTAEKGEINRKTLDFVSGALLEMNPRNATETLLVSQMIANHLLSMKLARLAVTTITANDSLERLERLESMTTKMMRTTTAQMEALHKLRNGGKQKVTVEHVHVHEGGQAIVGNVEAGGSK